MNHYELLYLVPATYSEEELAPIKEKVKELIAKREGKVTIEDSLGKKKLAYPINNVRHGYYLLYEFDLEKSKVIDLEKEIKLTPEVLRHQLVSKKVKSPSMIKMAEEKMKKREEFKEKEEAKQAEEKREEIKSSKDKDKIKLEDLDDKLDELLEGNIL